MCWRPARFLNGLTGRPPPPAKRSAARSHAGQCGPRRCDPARDMLERWLTLNAPPQHENRVIRGSQTSRPRTRRSTESIEPIRLLRTCRTPPKRTVKRPAHPQETSIENRLAAGNFTAAKTAPRADRRRARRHRGEGLLDVFGHVAVRVLAEVPLPGLLPPRPPPRDRLPHAHTCCVLRGCRAAVLRPIEEASDRLLSLSVVLRPRSPPGLYRTSIHSVQLY
jgi:hypothetical protein